MSIVAPPLLPLAHHFPISRSTTPTHGSVTPPRLHHGSSRPSTPPPPGGAPGFINLNSHLVAPLQPISAPPTPVTTTHFIGMERCRSSEPVLVSSSHEHPNPSSNPKDSRSPHRQPYQGSPLGHPISSGSGKGKADAALPHDRERDVSATRGGRGRDVKATSLLFQSTGLDDLTREQVKNNEKGEWIHVEQTDAPIITDTKVEESPPQIEKQDLQLQNDQQEEDDKMDVDEQVDPDAEARDEMDEQQQTYDNDLDDFRRIWGMPKWGWEDERREVRKGVRLVGVEELPGLLEQHAMLDVPSQMLFPWAHGLDDGGQKGRDMAAFFGHAPPFRPPSFRGLSLLLCPPTNMDKIRRARPAIARPPAPPAPRDFTRERSETMSTSSESYYSSGGTTEGTSPSVADWKDPTASPSVPISPISEDDVQMHPTESKRVSPSSPSQNLEDGAESPMPGVPTISLDEDGPAAVSDSSASEEEEETGPSCILLNALHVQDIFDIPGIGKYDDLPRFKPARLPNQINLRNLNIQQIKYTTISDVILYAKGGVNEAVLHVAEMISRAQDQLYNSRMEEYYQFVHEDDGEGEGVNRPIRYGVWVLVEPFHKVEAFCPELVNLDSAGKPTVNSPLTDLFEREAKESRAMTRGTEVVEGFWAGNDCDVPGGADDGAGSQVQFDLCVKASEMCEMPSTYTINATFRKLTELDRKRQVKLDESSHSSHSWTASPATIALRNLLSPSTSDVPSKRGASPEADSPRTRKSASGKPDPAYVAIECAGSARTFTGQMRHIGIMSDQIVECVYFLRKLVEGRDKSGIKRKVLIHCQDGYTESSIIVLAYIMSSLSISLPEAFLHLQVTAGRSFFLYPGDRSLLRKVDHKLAADRRAKALKFVSSTNASSSPSSSASVSRWKSWGLGGNSNKAETLERDKVVENAAREMLNEEEKGGSEVALSAKVWFEDRRFDGFPSRILPFLYLGNLEHAGNAAMLEAIGITHVVSVGETLISCPPDCDPMYGNMGENTLCNASRNGKIQVLDLNDVRDDGNDPLRPLIARACHWIEQARARGGKILVHCRVGVSRSASIVIAYMMQHEGMGLMDAYLLTRARRLNVLIQPNLRFFHELFGWEVELARREEMEFQQSQLQSPFQNGDSLGLAIDLGAKRPDKRRIMYSWPAFCRDLHCLNRRFLCN